MQRKWRKFNGEGDQRSKRLTLQELRVMLGKITFTPCSVRKETFCEKLFFISVVDSHRALVLQGNWNLFYFSSCISLFARLFGWKERFPISQSLHPQKRTRTERTRRSPSGACESAVTSTSKRIPGTMRRLCVPHRSRLQTCCVLSCL